MPGLDGTGPWGLGPRTGRGLGLCPPGVNPYRAYPYAPFGSYSWPVFGVGRGGLPWGGGRGRAWGGGIGWRSRFWGYAPPFHLIPPGQIDEKEWLKEKATTLEEELKQIRNRIEEMEKSQGE